MIYRNDNAFSAEIDKEKIDFLLIEMLTMNFMNDLLFAIGIVSILLQRLFVVQLQIHQGHAEGRLEIGNVLQNPCVQIVVISVENENIQRFGSFALDVCIQLTNKIDRFSNTLRAARMASDVPRTSICIAAK